MKLLGEVKHWLMLNLPANFASDIAGRDTALVPVVVFRDIPFPDVSGFRISTNSFVLNNDYYYPILLNIPSLKESVDVSTRRYKISSINIDVSNFPLPNNGKRFSDIVGDYSLMNGKVEVHWVSPSAISLADASSTVSDKTSLWIYNGTIRRYTHDDEKVRLVVEDRSQTTLHRDLPLEKNHLGTGDEIPDKYKNKPIPMVYGHVDRSPCVISRATPLGDETIIYEDVVIEADSSDGIVLNAEYDNDGNQITSPLFISTGSGYAKVPNTHNDIYFPDTDRDFYSSTQYIIDNQNKNILLTSSYQGTSESSTTGGNSISNNQLLAYEIITPTTFLPLQVESSQGIGVLNYWYTTLLDPTWSAAKRIHGTLFLEVGAYDGWGGESLLDGTDIPEGFIVQDGAWQGSLVGCQIKVPITTPSNLKASVGYVRVHIKAGFYNKYHLITGSTTEDTDITVRFGGDKHGDNNLYKSFSNESLTGTGNTWTEVGNQLNPLSDDSGYGDYDTHNSFSGSDPPITVENIETLLCYMRIDGGNNIMIGVIDFVDIEVDHWMQISDMLDQNYYADVKGRNYLATETMAETTQAIIATILWSELGQPPPVTFTSASYDSWKYAFTVDKKINSKKLIEGIASASPYIPRFDNIGNFKFDVIPENGGTIEGSENHTIKEADVIDFSFSRTPIEDVYTKIVFKYNWDYARKEFNDSVESDIAILGFGDYKFNYYGFSDDDHSKSTLVIDDDRGKYIRVPDTAQSFADWYLLWSCNQHLKLKVKLPLKYMNLEIGDMVRFGKAINNNFIGELLGGIKPYGIDYRIIDDINGQTAYVNFLVTSTSKTLEWVEISCIQMHSLVGDCSYPDIDCLGICDGNAFVDTCGQCVTEEINYGECGCADIPEGDCDCSGNILDACGVCGGFNTDMDQCGVCNGDGSSCSPIANAGVDQAVQASGTLVTLDASGSYVPNGGEIDQYYWTQEAGETVVLENGNTMIATFNTPSVTGNLNFKLTVLYEDMFAHDYIDINVLNNPPTANAGDDFESWEFTEVQLNGSGSSDLEGDITFEWKQWDFIDGGSPQGDEFIPLEIYQWEAPYGEAILDDNTIANPTFTMPEVPPLLLGDMVFSQMYWTMFFKLTVTDSDGATASDIVEIGNNASDNCQVGDMNGDGFCDEDDLDLLYDCVEADNCNSNPLWACAGDVISGGGYTWDDILELSNCYLAGTCGCGDE